jgi:uncharacterized protein (DUF2141 family)
MNRIATIGFGLSLALLAASARAADLRVEVHGVHNAKGKVMIGLFDKAADFPDKMVQGLALDAAATTVTGVFTGLPNGEFAVAVYQDENGNGKLDKNLFGVPTEPYGFSRDASGRMGPPKFADAKLSINGPDQTIVVNLH